MDSGRAPALLPPNQAAFLVNAQTRSGFPANRPGWFKRTLTGDEFQLGRWQGASAYISAEGYPHLVASIGGYIVRFDVLTGKVLVLSDAALDTVNPSIRPRAWFVQAEQFLCIQDNSSIPLIFDGATLRRGVPIAFGGEEFPIGNIMEYNNGRLWVALPDGRSFVGGDLAYSVTGDASDVLKSTQNQFLTSGSFALPATAGFITAMRSIANQDSVIGQGPLIVCGQYAAATVNAPFNADAWQNSDSPIVSIGLLSQGPSGQNACVNVNGDLWYRSRDGIRSFMIARRDHGTWVNTPVSHEMERVLGRDDPYLLDWASGVEFDNRLLITSSPKRAVDDGTVYGVSFRGLNVLDFTRVASMFDRTQPTWEGIWNGLSILQILTVNCYGKDRCFMFALNDCFQIELWELSRGNSFDNLTDGIQWSLETRNMGFEDQAEFLKQLVRTETWLENIAGEVDYAIQYRPDGANAWQDLDSGSVCATTGICESPECTAPSAPLKQYRARKISSAPSDTSCEECTQKQYRNGFEYQFRLAFTGAASVRRFRAVATNVPEEVTGGCLGVEDCCEETGCEPDPWAYRTSNRCCFLEIDTQPESQSIVPGGTLVLSIAVSGAVGSVTYQWYFNGSPLVNGSFAGATISGATTATLTIENITEELQGSYTVTATDGGVEDCFVLSDAAAINVVPPCTLEISEQPIGQTFSDGGTITLLVSYIGAVGTVSFQWYKDDVALVNGPSGGATITGATSAELSITNADASFAGDYKVVLTDNGTLDCSVTSDTVTVAFCAITITTEPISQELGEGGTLELEFAYSGAVGPVTIQWYFNDVALVDGESGGSTIAGATTAILTITNWTSAFAGEFYAIATDEGVSDCSVQTSTATVSVNPECTLVVDSEVGGGVCNLLILTEPEPVTVDVGDPVELSFTFSAYGSITIQWYKDDVALADGPTGTGSTISGATTDTLTITDSTESDSGDYYAIITNEYSADCDGQTDTVAVLVEPPIADSPTAYWRMDEINEPIVDGEGPATDRADAIASTDLIFQGSEVPGFEDAIGGVAASALFLDDELGWLKTELPAALAYTSGNSVSFCFWHKYVTDPAVGDAAPAFYFTLGDGPPPSGSGAQFYFEIYRDGSDFELWVAVDGVDYGEVIVNPYSPAIDTWYFYTVVYDADTDLISLYINGTLIGTSVNPAPVSSNAAGEVQVYSNGVNIVQTQVSQAGLWLNHKLTQPQIDYLYNSGAGRNWPFTLP